MEEDKYVDQVKYFQRYLELLMVFMFTLLCKSCHDCLSCILRNCNIMGTVPGKPTILQGFQGSYYVELCKWSYEIFMDSLFSCWVAGKTAASVTCCNLVFLLSEYRVFPQGVTWAVACRPSGLAGNSTCCHWSIQAILLAFFLPFLLKYMHFHSYFICIYFLFQVASYLWPQRMGQRWPGQQQTLKHFYHAQKLLYALFRFLHGTHCVHRRWRPYVYCPGRILWPCDGHL